MTPRDIESRMQRLFDGKLTPDERASLLAEIRRDPALLEIYLDYAALEAALSRLARSDASLRAEPTIDHKTTLRKPVKHPFRWNLLATAAVLALSAVALHLVFFRTPHPVVTFRLSPDSVIDVSHAMVKRVPPQGNLMPGSRARLDQGTVELTFASGVHAILMAPADLTLHDGGNLFMQTGTGWFHVPPNATGFKVQTPGMIVTDLGTTFGVIARKDSPPQAHVFKGKVNLLTQGKDAATESLDAGMARAIESGGKLTEVPVAPEKFLTSLPDSLPHLHWSFDQAVTLADAQGSLPAAVSGSSRMDGLENPADFGTAAGKFGSALATTGAFAEARSGWSGIDGAAPRTIAYWIKIESDGPDVQPILGWGSHALTPFNPNPAFLTYVRRIKTGTLAGVSFGSYHLNGTTPIQNEQWHHFAVVYSGRSLPDGRPDLACYLDGKPEIMNPEFRTDILSKDSPKALSIQTLSSVSESIPLTLFPRDWCDGGRAHNLPLALDELYIFEAALNAARVKQLYQNNRIE